MWHDNDKMVAVYNNITEDINKFPCECPACNCNSVHVYIHDHGDGHCGIWAWCSECGAFSHMSGQTPTWWKNPVFINEYELCSEPDYLDTKSLEIDEWVNGFNSCKRSKPQPNVIEDRFNVKLTTDIQGISSGTEGVIVVKNDFNTITVQFIRKDGVTTDILLDHAKLMKAVEIL